MTDFTITSGQAGKLLGFDDSESPRLARALGEKGYIPCDLGKGPNAHVRFKLADVIEFKERNNPYPDAELRTSGGHPSRGEGE